MKCKFLALLGLFGALTLGTQAGLAQSSVANTGNGTDNPDWTEEEVTTPPPFAPKHLIAIDMPVYVTTKASLDPDTLVVGSDGVVRYVMVMTNASGNVSAVYEGIRCVTDEVKTYARLGTSGKWSMVKNPVWRAVTDNLPSKHALAFARQGGCYNYLATSKQEILAQLKTVERPFEGQYKQ